MRIEIGFLPIVILSLLTGCSGSTNISSNPSETTGPDSFPTPVITQISSSNLTATPEQYESSTAFPLASGLSEPHELVKELLENNGGCKLPCWWGITPGATSWQETEHFLGYLGATIGQTEISSEVILHWAYFKENLLDLDLSFFEREVQKEIVDSISVIGNHGSTQNQTDFESLWESYSPKAVIRAYGAPSRVLLSTTGVTGYGDSGNHGYILWVFYDQLGFMIRYNGTVADLPVYHFCPELKIGANDIDRIDITLQHLDNPLPLEWDDGILATDPSRAMSIQVSAGISIEEFYRLFIQDDKPACFDTPHDIWPVR